MYKIFLYQRIVPHYRIAVFDYLAKLLGGMFRVIFGTERSGDSVRNDKEAIRQRNYFVQGKTLYAGKAFFIPKFWALMFKYRSVPKVVILQGDVSSIDTLLCLLLRSVFKARCVVWSFGYHPKRGFDPRAFWQDRIRLWMFNKADVVLVYWNQGKQVISRWIECPEKIVVAPNTLDTRRLHAIFQQLKEKGRETLKMELGVKESYHLVYVGRLVADKQVDFLLRAFARIENNYEVRLTIIGEGPEKERLQSLAKELGIKKVRWLGAQYDIEVTARWLFISDAFLMPGRLGLSVIHAFSFGVPVISLAHGDYFHGEGIGYIKQWQNGVLVEDYDIDAFADVVGKILSDSDLRCTMRSSALQTAYEEASIGRMINGLLRAISIAVDGN